MTGNGYFQLALYLIALIGLGWPLGLYMARIYRDNIPVFMRWLRPVERGLYRLCGVKPDDDMPWTRYAFAMIAFNLMGFLAVYALQRLQVWLPLNPEGLAAVTPDSSFNTAVSFATNTNWQGYGGETTMSYLTQMLGLNVQNFLSAATGMAVLVALMRGLNR
jgi:K+-transporting ATPase ATPase A chain